MSKDLSARYYQKKEERSQKNACKRCQDVSEEEKNKKREYDRTQLKNLLEDEKHSVVEYKKKHCKTWKNKIPSKIKTDYCFWLATIGRLFSDKYKWRFLEIYVLSEF